MTSMLSLFESITCLSLIHLEEIKLIAIVNGFFDMSDFWRLVGFCFCHHYFHIQ